MPKCLDIPIIYIAYKKNRQILVWKYQKNLIWRYRRILGSKYHARKSKQIHKSSWTVFCLKMFWYSQYILLTCTKSIFTTSQSILLYTNFISKNWFYFCPHLLASTNSTILLDTTLIKQIMLFLRIFADKVYHHLLCITHIINIATFLKVMSSSKLSPVSIKTLALSKFSMPNISVLQSYLIIDLAYNHQSSNIFFLHVLQSFVLIHHNAI